jgi:TPP-dependent indolepyruvate ferredoxin oxidoreductase alpha subunit
VPWSGRPDLDRQPPVRRPHRLLPFEPMVRGDWPDLEYLVIGTGVRVLRANEAAASISATVQALNGANSALPQQATAADVSKLAKMCAAQVAALEAAATALETEMAAIAPGQNRIIDIIDADHEATGVAEEYLGGAVSLGAAAAYVIEELARLPRSLEKLGRTFPMVEEATVGLASAIRRVLVALEPAIGWGNRSAAILSDWD